MATDSRIILSRQEQAGWGAKVVDRLVHDLREAYPDMAGISPRNLKYMRAFAAAWPDAAIVQRAVAQLPWRQNIALLERQRDPQIRLWYAAQPTSRFSDNTDRSIARLANIEICISRASQRERVQENSSTFLAAI